ncbi:MAG: mechanosensitive ion channel family protein [Gammaproteobacteria bacterium]|nr:mechanosensitive ion channel family protein [Gammaproteobacteria bacterium]MBU0847892.1 mechanosensitive ion channel family protein [Gammaproteobacteria bacterium]MBU1780071.1 mechanosensitive ion channel family protein [Gammaproteobacteria bacterium]MBU2086207.1 mechanosensitive ion channel family protein [Gammaproteobacteria bacterium]MBU2128885.1 mechanosensitive ion channel family protein [Gammaproteobacteria bacterium]
MSFYSLHQWFASVGVPSSVLNHNTWVYQVFAVVFLTLLLSYIAGLVFDRLCRFASNSVNLWDDVLLESARKPVRVLIWLIGILWAAQIAHTASEAEVFQFIDPIRRVGVIVVITWFLFGLAKRFELALQSPGRVKEPLDATTASAIGKLLRASIIITATLVILQNLGFSISGVLAFGGVGGIAVGFAAKDLLANFFGGLAVYMDRPFVVGDWVRSPDKNIEGTVEHIGWRLTRIRTFDQRPLYVPNATFSTISLENPSRMTHRRIQETIGVRYEDIAQVRNIVDSVKCMLVDHTEIDDKQTLIVNLNQFGDSSVNLMVYTFTKTTIWVKYHEVKQDVLLKIAEIIEQHGASIAFPTTTLHVASLPEQFAQAGMLQNKV